MSELALVLGLPSEPPVAAVVRALESAAVPHAVLDQRRLVSGSARTWWADGCAGGVIDAGDGPITLGDVTGVYTRLTTWSDLPEVAAEPSLLPHVAQLHYAVEAWLETTRACVVNRTSANDSNNSKPYQALIIRDHFQVPATLITNDPLAASEFRREHGRVIYKSVSGERSVVTEMTDDEVDRLHLLTSGPVQFQEHVAGVDLRVHVVGDEVFGTAIESTAVDYRYDNSGGTTMRAVAVDNEVATECVTLTARLGLILAGIDLRLADDGRVVCFEVNPSPAFIVYEDATSQPIAAAIAHRLAGS